MTTPELLSDFGAVDGAVDLAPAHARGARRFLLWDLPLRVFHWSLVGAVTTAVVTGELGGAWMPWHGRAGLAIVGLLVFRHRLGRRRLGDVALRAASRRRRRALLAYLRGRWRGVGHNPLGALSVFALLALLSAQVATGLFGNDDIAFAGPLNHLVGRRAGSRATGWHRLLADGLFVLLALHLLAVAFHVIVKRHRLIRPMITGLQDVDAGHAVAAPARARPWPLRTAGGRVARRGRACSRSRAPASIGRGRRPSSASRPPPSSKARGLGAGLVGHAQRAGASSCTAASACSTFSTGESPSNAAAMRPSGVTTKVLRSAKPWSICTPRVSLRPGAASRTASA